jgi:hypothetical protein
MLREGTFMLLFPILIMLVYLGVMAYFLWLATRLVNAVETIAQSVKSRLPPQR